MSHNHGKDHPAKEEQWKQDHPENKTDDSNSKKADIPIHFPAYDPKIFWKMDWKGLPVDCALIIFGIIFSNGYFSNRFFTEIAPGKLLVIFLFVVIAVSWYMGFILARYQVYYSRKINIMARWVFGITGITLLGYLMAATFPLLNTPDSDKTGTSLAMFATFFLVLGPFFGIGGWMTGDRILKMESDEKPKNNELGADEMFYVVMVAILTSIAFLIRTSQCDFVQQSSWSFFWFILIFIGAAFAGVFAIGILMAIKWMLVKIGIYYRLAFIFETSFPLFIISSLIFWNEIQRHYLSGINPTEYLGILFFTGILPFRFLLIFNPPLRMINLLIGIASFIFYIICIR